VGGGEVLGHLLGKAGRGGKAERQRKCG
jgi:hypothetical protein